MGRLKKSSEIKVLTGTARNRTAKIVEGVQLSNIPAPMPLVMENELAFRLYEHHASDLIARGLLTTADIFMLQIFCLEMASYFELENKTKDKIIQTRQRGEFVLNPLVRQMNSHRDAALKIAKEFGFTSYSRSLIGKGMPVDADKGKEDEWDF